MIDLRQTLLPLTVIAGAAVSAAGILAAEPSLALAGVTCSAMSAAGALASQGRKHRADPHTLRIDGLNLDCLHLANLRRRLNKSLTVKRAFQVAIVDGTDLHLAWQYDGICRVRSETRIEFSIDSENNIPFEQLDCFAFDLQNDPLRVNQIRPALVGSDGVSKKISVPFLKALGRHEPFSMLLHCKLPDCIAAGQQYYTSSLSFDQPKIESASVHMIFVRTRPEWVRVNEFDGKGRPVFIGELRPFRDDGATCEYVDMAQNVPGQSVRVYVYNLPALGIRTEREQPTLAAQLFSRVLPARLRKVAGFKISY